MNRKYALPSAELFWAKVNKDGPTVRAELGPCWIWIGRIRKGYGVVRYGDGRRQTAIGAHKRSWILHFGETDLHVLHRCDTPTCVRPEHLFLGTNAENMADKIAKGRGAIGTRYPQALLTDDAAREMRRLHEAGATVKSLATRFGVHHATAAGVLRGDTWRHVDSQGPPADSESASARATPTDKKEPTWSQAELTKLNNDAGDWPK